MSRFCAECGGRGWHTPDADTGGQRACGSCGGTGLPAVPVRLIDIRKRLDRAITQGFGGWAREDLIDDLRWLLDEHKRLRRA